MTTQRCKVLLSITCAVMAIGLILPPTLAFFIAGYAAEAARQKAYEPARCTVLDIRLFELTCQGPYSCLYRAGSIIYLQSPERKLNILQQRLTRIYETKREAYSAAVEAWGYISKNFTCYFDTTTLFANNSTTTAEVDWALAPPDPTPFLIGSCVLLGLVVVMLSISTIFFIRWYRKRIWLQEHPVVHPIQQEVEDPQNQQNQQPNSIRRSRVSSKQATIDLIRMDLDASADPDVDEDTICNVCFAHHISVKMVPCGHAFTCATCGQYFVNRPCGLCRLDVTHIEALPKPKPKQENQEETSSSNPTSLKRNRREKTAVKREPDRVEDDDDSDEADSGSNSSKSTGSVKPDVESSLDPSDYSASSSLASASSDLESDSDSDSESAQRSIRPLPRRIITSSLAVLDEQSASIGFESSTEEL